MVPFGRGVVRRPGEDLTIVTWGATVQKSLEAAEAVAADGREVEVIDLRTIEPWDHDLVAESVRRTRRLLVVHEDVLTGGFGRRGGGLGRRALLHRPRRPGAPGRRADTHVAYEPTLEDAILPQVDDIPAAARDLLAF